MMALGLGVLGGYLFFGDDSDSTDTAEIACDMASRLNLDGSFEDWNGLDDPRMWDAQAIGPLLHAAALRDDKFKELGEAGDQFYRSIVEVNPEKYEESIGEILRLCDDV